MTGNKTRADVTPQSAFEIVSTTNGVLNPRLTTAQRSTWEGTFNGTTHVTGPAGAGDEKHSRQGELIYDLNATNNNGSTGEFKVRTRSGGTWVTERVAFVSPGSGESTTIGPFQAAGNAAGLSLSGTDVRLHAATTTQPGGVNVGLQSITGPKKIETAANTTQFQLELVDSGGTDGGGISFNNLTVREASIVGTSISGGGTLNFSVRDGGSPANVMELVTTNSSTQGMTSHLGLIEDVNIQTGTTYTFVSADRNVVAGGSASQTYTLQVIGSGAGQTASGRVIYIYNDTSFTLTINAGAGNTINGVASLIVPFNTGVTVKALTSSKWGSF